MRRLSLLVFVVCSSLIAQWPYYGIRERITIPTHYPNIVRIQIGQAYCTGWIAAKHIFVTASHCYDEATESDALFDDGRRSKLRLLWRGNHKTYPAADFAFLWGDTYDLAPIPLSPLKPKFPTMCESIGYGQDGIQKAAPCVATENRASAEPVKKLRFYIGEIDFGDSGGPVFDGQYRAIGITVQVNAFIPAAEYVVPIELVAAKLRPLLK